MSRGFTLTEVLVVITIFLLVLGAVYSSYLLSQKAFKEGEVAAELTQNSRVILERITREVRQAREIVTELSSSKENATSTLEFEDGNIQERYHYIHYFQENTEIKREVKRYYFSGDPNTFVTFNATPPPGEELLFIVTQEPQIIGEFVKELKIWASGIRIIDIFITLEKGEKQVDFSTKIFGRNL